MTGRARRGPRVKKAYKGIPANLTDLYESGQRIRYNGFWLTDSEKDRAIARFIDKNPVEVTELVKDFLYRKSQGEDADQSIEWFRYIAGLVESLQGMIQAGVVMVDQKPENKAMSDEAQRTLDALRNFST